MDEPFVVRAQALQEIQDECGLTLTREIIDKCILLIIELMTSFDLVEDEVSEKDIMNLIDTSPNKAGLTKDELYNLFYSLSVHDPARRFSQYHITEVYLLTILEAYYNRDGGMDDDNDDDTQQHGVVRLPQFIMDFVNDTENGLSAQKYEETDLHCFLSELVLVLDPKSLTEDEWPVWWWRPYENKDSAIVNTASDYE